MKERVDVKERCVESLTDAFFTIERPVITFMVQYTLIDGVPRLSKAFRFHCDAYELRQSLLCYAEVLSAEVVRSDRLRTVEVASPTVVS